MGNDVQDSQSAKKSRSLPSCGIMAKIRLGIAIGFHRNETHKKAVSSAGVLSTVQGLEQYINASRHVNAGLEVAPVPGPEAGLDPVMLDENEFSGYTLPVRKREKHRVVSHWRSRLQTVYVCLYLLC